MAQATPMPTPTPMWMPAPGFERFDDPAIDGESTLSVAAVCVACSLLLGVLVIAFAVLARAAMPGWSIDTHRQPALVSIHHAV
jgi:hypothetical protein